MKIIKNKTLFIFLFSLFSLSINAQVENLHPKSNLIIEKKLSGINNKNYFQGVSAHYSGVINNKLIIAGGCNFPNKPAKDGGKKQYYKEIYIADLSNENMLKFSKVGKMVKAIAYGVSIVYNNKLICVGGNTSNESLSSVFSISYDNELEIDSLPSLPVTIDNMSGTVVNNRLYIIGGNVNGHPSTSVYVMNLEKLSNGWHLETEMPGKPRVQSVCISHSGNIYVWGGFSTKDSNNEASVSCDGLRYNPQTKEWKQLKAPIDSKGEEVSFGGGSAVSIENGKILFVGGVNKDIFLKALNGEYSGKEYLSKPVDWYKFNINIFVYNINSDQWEIIGESSLSARAGASLVKNEDKCYLINGEIKPGIRTNSICEIRL